MGVGIGGSGSIACSVSGSKINHLFTLSSGSIRVRSIAQSIRGQESETTSVGAGGIKTFAPGLKEGEFRFEGVYPRASPVHGNTYLLTMSGGPTYKVRSIELSIEFGQPVDITSPAGAATSWKTFALEGGYSWMMTVTGVYDNSAAPIVPPAANAAGTAVTFKVAEGGASDPTISGDAIIVSGADLTVGANGVVTQTHTLRGTGPLTFAAGSGDYLSILPAGSMTAPVTDWDADDDGTPDITTVVTLASGRTITAPMALTNLTIRCEPTAIISVDGTLKVMGAPAFA